VDELRKDPTRGQWVLIRPKAEPPADGPCPYCPGAESLSGGEIAAYRKEGSPANSPDWTVRVVPEHDAYFRIERELAREGVGMFDMITPRGASELIIESPRHDDTPATMGEEQLGLVGSDEGECRVADQRTGGRGDDRRDRVAERLGPGRRSEQTGEIIPLGIKVGDTVVYSKYGGTEITIDGEDLLILTSRDVLATVSKK